MVKKMVGFAVMVALFAVPAFAQEDEGDEGAPKVKITGEVKTGIKAADNDFALYSDDVGDGTGLRADLNALYDAGNWGVKIGVRGGVLNGWRYNATTTGANQTPEVISDVGLREGFAFFKLLDGMIDIKGGLIDSAVWNTAGLDDENLSNGYGVRLEATPIAGLNVGIVLGGTSALLHGESGDYLGAEDFFKRTTIGASYTTDAFYAAAAFKLKKDDAIGVVHTNGQQHIAITSAENALAVGLGLTAVENLNATLEALFLSGIKETEKAKFNLDVVYDVQEKIHAGVEANIENLKEFYVKATPKAGYDLTENITVDLFIPLDIKNEAEKFCLGVKPKVTYKLGGSSKVVLFDQIDVISADDKVHNTIQLDFVYSF